jgi:TRAP-type C4-dicarboxylate transport system permease small subunit
MYRSLHSGIQRASTVFFVLAQVTIAAMMLTTAYDTIMRYFFAAPTIWAVELNERLLIVITLLAGAQLVKMDQHIQMDLFYNLFPVGGQKASRVLIWVVGILFCGCFFWVGLQSTITTYVGKVYASGAFRMPYWVVYGLIPLGMALMFFEFLFRLIAEFIPEGRKGGNP